MKLLSAYNAHIKTLFVMTGVFGFSMAILTFTMAPYLQRALGTNNISVIYLIPEVIVLTCFAWFLGRVGQAGKMAVFFSLLFLQILLLSATIFFEGTKTSAFFIVIHLAILPFLMILLDMLLEAHSRDEDTGRVRGLYIFFGSFGFLIAPVVGGFIVDRYGFSSIFFVAVLCYVVMFLLALSRYLSEGTPETSKKISFLEIAQRLLRDGDIGRIYIISLLLEGFYVMSVITFPLYLIKMGLTLSQSGLIFTVMLLPFILFAYPAGRLADMRWGEKEILVSAMIFLGMVLLVISRVETGSIYVWMVLFFSTRIGASLMETMRDSYFFRKVGGEDVELISFFRTARSIGILIAAGITFIFLYFGDLYDKLFMFSAVCIFLGALVALQLKDSEPNSSSIENR